METLQRTKRRIVFCDVDNTTVDTGVFVNRLLDVLWSEWSIEPAAYSHEMQRFYVTGRGYNLKQHLRMYGLKLSKIRPQLIQQLSRHNLLYGDSVIMIGQLLDDLDTDVICVTSGRHSFQSLKFDLINYELERRLGRPVRQVRGLAVCGKKAHFLADFWSHHFVYDETSYHEVLIVDDHPEQIAAFEPRDNLKLIQARHQNPKYGPVAGRPDIEQVFDLKTVR